MPGDYRLAYDALDAEFSKNGIRRLWILGVDPGNTTGASLISIPRGSIYGDERGKILSHTSWELHGSLRMQVRNVCSIAMRVNTPTSPCLIVTEDYDLGGNRVTGSAAENDIVSPIRVGAALWHAVECGHADNAVMTFQGRTIAMTTATDDRLKKWGLYDVGSAHKRDGTRHAVTMVRRISSGSVDPDDIWGEASE
jgi:hypothetical protein